MMEKMLFVDDDPICSHLNVALVKGLGMAKEVVSLPGAEEALIYIQEHYPAKPAAAGSFPDFIFLDVHMPDMDGFELLETLKNRQLLDKSRFLIVMLSASLDPADLEKATRYDIISACLPKPLAAEDLQQVLAGVLAH